jgi:hypothetical protein
MVAPRKAGWTVPTSGGNRRFSANGIHAAMTVSPHKNKKPRGPADSTGPTRLALFQ